MLWKTHIRIADKVLYKLGVPNSSFEAAKLREGEVAPDKWEDYPHHHNKSRSIRKYIMKARKSFLNGDLSSAYFFLGVALHYIQDSYTSFSSRFKRHNEWEQQIEQSHFVDDLEKLVAWAFRQREDRKEEYTQILAFLSEEVKGKQDTLNLATMPGPGFSTWHERAWGRPDVDLNFAFRASFLVAKAVLGSRTCSKLQTELNQVLAEYETKLRDTEITFADKIVELIRKRDDLNKKRKPTGIFPIIKSYFSTLLSKIYNWRAESKTEEYEQQKHLKRIAREYQDAAQSIIAPHIDWYNITIPEIDINIVEKELLSMQEASRSFGLHESTIKYLVEKGKISCCRVRNKELFRKSEWTHNKEL